MRLAHSQPLLKPLFGTDFVGSSFVNNRLVVFIFVCQL